VVFSELRKHGAIAKSFEISCGQCIGCRLRRARDWAMRCMHEASLYDENCFITLTFKDVGFRPQLRYQIFQKFLRRLRHYRSWFHFDPAGVYYPKSDTHRAKLIRVFPKLRYFVAGEYGEEHDRPHFHAILFGYNFADRTKIRQLDSGCDIYRSATLERLWPYGYSSIGQVTFESAAYIAKYCVKKKTGLHSVQHYTRCDEFGEYELEPEFAHMSLKPGIGAPWLKKFKTDVYPHDYVIVDGMKLPPPRYYDKLFDVLVREFGPPTREEFYAMERVKSIREIDGLERWEDNTSARLEVRAQVARAKNDLYKRKL
jgi:hypothetical protein